MPKKVALRSTFKVSVGGEQREGVCESCGTLTVKEFYMDGTRRRVHMICPECGGQGRLIVRLFSIQPPPPPQCMAFKCMVKFFKDTLLSALLASYHRRRVFYATTNRRKKILERYRTGEPSPQNIWQAIHANLKLTCPICRKYNVDPFLFKKGGENV